MTDGVIGAVIVARMGSSRLPGKSLVPIEGIPSLEMLIRRAAQSRYISRFVIATTVDPKDDAIETFAKKINVACFRGSEEDVLGRVLGAAQSIGLQHIVHLTGDCPLMDPDIIDQTIDLYLQADVDYAKNFLWGEGVDGTKNFPNGLDVEVIRRGSLEALNKMTSDPWLREHVTEPFYTWPEFRFVTLEAPPFLQRGEVRLCVDTKEDLEVVSTVARHFKDRGLKYSAIEIIEFLNGNPQLLEINSKITQKKYTAAVLGLGFIGSLYDSDPLMSGINSHSGAYKFWSKTNLVAGIDLDPAKQKLFREKWGNIETYSGLSNLFSKTGVDILSVCTQTDHHFPAILEALKGPVKVIICEKPFVRDEVQGRELIRLSEEKNIPILVNHWLRYTELFQNLRFFLENKGLGKTIMGSYIYSKGLFNSGSHAIDILMYLLGPIDSVRSLRKYELDTKDFNHDAFISFKDGHRIHLIANDYRNHFTTEIDLIGDKGRIKILDDAREVSYYQAFPSKYQSNAKELEKRPVPFKTDLGTPMVKLIDNAVDVLEGKAFPTCSAEDALGTIMVLERIKESEERGGAEIRL
jgi:spore coat polysaccharide biosynthesis protein SpsF (cytidylyltransferase family)/predicted dehydrogenase